MNVIIEFQHYINTTAASIACGVYSQSIKVTKGELAIDRFFTSGPLIYATVFAVNESDSAIQKIIKKIPTMEQKGLVFFK